MKVKIKTEIPGPRSIELSQQRSKAVPGAMGLYVVFLLLELKTQT